MKKQMTIREIIKVLSENEKYTVIGVDEMSNKESRDFFSEKDNLDEIMNVIDNGSHLLIWGINPFIANTAKDYDVSYDTVEFYYNRYGSTNMFYEKLEEHIKIGFS